MKVLVLEHSRVYSRMLRELLEEVGCEVDCVRNSDDGLARLRNNMEEYCLIIAGQHIFDGTSSEFVQHCSRHSDHCPILLLTSEPNETLLTNARLAGVRDIFPKTDVAKLRESIHYYIEGTKSFSIGGRVAYIEDSASVAFAIRKMLENIGLEVDHFTNAEKAYVEIVQHPYDLVITDVVLEGPMSGVTLVRMLRAHKSYLKNLPILAITGQDDPHRRIELFHAGVNDYVTKPPIEEELAARVNNLISNKRLLDQVHEQKRSLFEAAMKDKLTSCHNRHSLAETAPKVLHDAMRYEYPVCLMILDLDHFKLVNDEYGHDIGDDVLRDVGRLLMTSFRQGDFVARIGGEEFLVILPHCTTRDAMAKAEEIRASIESFQPGGLPVTSSIGVASLAGRHRGEYDKLFRSADRAVYASKKAGRNCVTLDNPDLDIKAAG